MIKCLFCNIAHGNIPANIVFQDQDLLIISDIHPQAPTHLLIIPKRHIATINDANDDDKLLLGHMILAAKRIAKEMQIAEDGYRLVFNTNQGGGQEVYHIHLHLLGGRQLHWPPG